MTIVLQGNTKSHPQLTKVPVSINFAKTDEAKRLMQIVSQSHRPAVRPFVLPPRTPKDRVQILRRGFIDTMKRSGVLGRDKEGEPRHQSDRRRDAGAKRQGDLKLEPTLVAKLKDILK